MSLLDLPNDLLLQISHHLNRQDDLYSLSLVCRTLHHKFFGDYLYIFNIKHRLKTGLFWAAEFGRVPTLQRFLALLSPEDNIDAPWPLAYHWYNDIFSNAHKTCLDLAMSGGHIEAVKVLLDYGAAPLRKNGRGQTPFYLALLSGNNALIEVFCQHIQEYSKCIVQFDNRYTALHVAAHACSAKWTRYFLDHGAYVNALDTQGRTPLCHAVFNSPEMNRLRDPKRRHLQVYETLRVLIEFGADPHAVTAHKWGGVFISTAGEHHVNSDVRGLFDPSKTKFSPYELQYLQGAYHTKGSEVACVSKDGTIMPNLETASPGNRAEHHDPETDDPDYFWGHDVVVTGSRVRIKNYPG